MITRCRHVFALLCLVLYTVVSHIVLAQNVEFLTTIVGGDLTADRVAATGISSNTLFVTDQPAF